MKNKGFTMVELLATILIIGILSTVAITGVGTIRSKMKESYYKRQEKLITSAGINYYSDNKRSRPYEIGGTDKVTLNTLVDQKYIEPVKDYGKEVCDTTKTYVKITKTSDKKYDYDTYLECKAYKSAATERNDTTKPTIVYDPNSKTAKNKVEVTIKMTDNLGIASYRYIITKDGKEYKDTNEIKYKSDPKVTLSEKGKYTIKAYAVDKAGNQSDITTSGQYEVTVGTPVCTDLIKANVAGDTWTKENITVTFKDASASNENIANYTIEVSEYNESTRTWGNYKTVQKNIASSYSMTLSNNKQTRIRVNGENSAGVTCSKTMTFKIDKTPPTCSFSYNCSVSGGINNWCRGTQTITATCANDNGSPCSANASKSFSSESDQAVTIGTIKDEAGNTTECSTTAKIDKTAPTCSTTYSCSLTGGTDNWCRGTQTIKATCANDAGSPCNTNASKTFSSESNQTVTIGTIKDEAGNTTECSATTKVDKTNPKGDHSITDRSGSGNNLQNATVARSCSDQGSVQSGIKSQPGNATLNINSVDSFLAGLGLPTLEYTCEDNAGNSVVVKPSYTYGKNSVCGTATCTNKDCCGETCGTCYTPTYNCGYNSCTYHNYMSYFAGCPYGSTPSGTCGSNCITCCRYINQTCGGVAYSCNCTPNTCTKSCCGNKTCWY